MRQTSSPGLARPRAQAMTVVKAMANKLHFHACLECGVGYSCHCATPVDNGHCQDHRLGHGADMERPSWRPPWDRARDPAECCSGKPPLELVTDVDEIRRYQLAGPGPWFNCPRCHRKHGAIVAHRILTNQETE